MPDENLSFTCTDPDDLMGKIVTFLILRSDQNFKQAQTENGLNKAYYKGIGHEIKRIAFALEHAPLHVVGPDKTPIDTDWAAAHKRYDDQFQSLMQAAKAGEDISGEVPYASTLRDGL